ncbi:MFS transporter [Micromonospora sp. NPDC023633]|uniref:MFS transporter n=1 Tax=Micromonospora sp. NPDC023633 TaxID=3154320 RepID=UPI0034092DE1
MVPAPVGQRRNIALFVVVSLVSGFGGTAMSLVAGIWVMALTSSASLAAMAGFCVFFPTLFGPLLGALVDRLPRRPLLVWTNLVVAASLLLLLAVRSADQVWLLYVVMLGYGISYVLLDAAEAAWLPAALPGDALGRVNGLRMSAQEGAKLLAPLLGAGLFTLLGGAGVAALAAAMLIIAAVLYRLVRAPGSRPPSRRRRIVDETWEGIRFLLGDARLRAIVLVGALVVTMSGLTTAATFAVVDEGLGLSVAFMGVLSSAQGAGALAGGLLTGRLMTGRGEALVGTLGAVLFAAGTAARLLPWTPGVVAGSVVVGVGLPWAVVAAMTAVQRRTPQDLLGRVAGTASTVVFGPMSIGIPLGAWLVAVADYRLTLVAVAILTVIGGLLLTGRASLTGADGEDAAAGGSATPDRAGTQASGAAAEGGSAARRGSAEAGVGVSDGDAQSPVEAREVG